MKIDTFIISDDVRQEVNNKNSIIGLYDEVIKFREPKVKKGKWPKMMKVGIYAKFKLLDDDLNQNIVSFKFKSKYKDKINEWVNGNFSQDNVVQIKSTKKIKLVIVIPNFLFMGEGNITFQFEFYNEKNDIIKNIEPEYNLKVIEELLV